MTWEIKQVKDVISINKGEYITKKDAEIGKYPVILGGREPAYYINKYNHEGKAIVISRSGAAAGYVSFWNEPIFVTDGFIIEPKGDVSFEYLYYFLKSKQKELMGLQTGSAIPHVTPSIINTIEVKIPPYEIQKYISHALSTYDTLIENNQKQINLLEEAAQRLYKEWFVDLRFPGYEHVKFVGSIPKEWELVMLGSITEFKRGKNITKDTSIEGKIPVIAGGLDPAYYISEWNVSGPAITVSGSGANAGFVNQHFSNIWASDCSYFEKHNSDYYYYVYCFLKFKQNEIYSMQKGSAQPHIYSKDINMLTILKPKEDILKYFNKIIGNIYQKISILSKQVIYAIEARDRLLPKLISGEIEVSP